MTVDFRAIFESEAAACFNIGAFTDTDVKPQPEAFEVEVHAELT